MKIYLSENVYQSSLERIEYLFNEFEEVVVSFSGGKDSTVVLNLCLEVAKKLNRLPLKVCFLDQEAEWQSVIDYIKRVMYRKDIEPMWFQVPIKLFNATSMENPWLYCWEKGGEWIRPKDDISIKENLYGSDRFVDSFKKIAQHYFKDKKMCYIAGVRSAESRGRQGIHADVTYKGIAYGKKLREGKHYTFYPIYDWEISDVWKYIFDNKLDYCKHYDKLYQQGIAIRDMRVSNLHHETAVHNLFFLHEVEPDTWEKLVNRLDGIHTTKHLAKEELFMVKKLPYMFKDWKDYRDYLTENLIQQEDYKKIFKKRWAKDDEKYEGKMRNIKVLFKKQITSLLANDWEFVKYGSFLRHNPHMIALNARLLGKYRPEHKVYNKFLLEEQ
jgi:predicted phosphoadenosine phosphosulfate sulfurtransferase